MVDFLHVNIVAFLLCSPCMFAIFGWHIKVPIENDTCCTIMSANIGHVHTCHVSKQSIFAPSYSLEKCTTVGLMISLLPPILTVLINDSRDLNWSFRLIAAVAIVSRGYLCIVLLLSRQRVAHLIWSLNQSSPSSNHVPTHRCAELVSTYAEQFLTFFYLL